MEISEQITREKVRKGNCERLFDRAKQYCASWELKNSKQQVSSIAGSTGVR